MAVAYGDNGYAFIESNANSSEEATAKALEGCGKSSTRCNLLGKPVAGPVALVIARAGDGVGVSANRDPLVAAELAMKECKARFKRGCRLEHVAWDEGDRWYAISTGNGGAYIEYGDESDTAAKSGALQGCRKRTDKAETCEIRAVSSKSGWIAMAEQETQYGWAVGSTKDEALAAARRECARAGGGKPCDDTTVVFNPGNTAAPDSVAAVQARIARQDEAASVPGKTDAVVRYADTCHNANCVRKYENGKTIRYTACLNPATSLPMNDPVRLGGCGGSDSRGNLFGMGGL
ncbi:DUF4189 domain-containing protein [Paraburkholderia phenoliruptrix]|uniref:DUF4189 domain-containing protein n=1 Tax=Paraburkholderia phenoliruptrix TaxID=252970 RepID=UPI0028673777|nr:DUF4189 domain-containing protein [Paraburkholderia phenoliruptrix]MDR6393509.1 hypothetical protein [Paraburkholderia phenoliruptrix]